MKRLGRTVALLTAAASLCSCAQSSARTVSIHALNSNVVFGAPTAAPAAAPVTFPPVASPPGTGAAGPIANLPAYLLGPSPAPFNYPTPGQAQVDCPKAGPNSFPKQAATVSVTTRPTPGSYRWKVTTVHPVAPKISVTTIAFVPHLIENVSAAALSPNPTGDGTPTTTFTFDEAVPGAGGTSVVTTYEVKENAIEADAGLGPAGDPAAGEPDRGVSLVRVRTLDAQGKQVGQAFTPTPAVLLFPLDVIVPQSFQSAGTDPVSGAALATDANVTGRDRVDACGDVVDGWQVQASETFTPPGGRPTVTQVTYDVATQLGGVLTRLTSRLSTSTQTAATDNDTVTQTIASLRPGPPQR